MPKTVVHLNLASPITLGAVAPFGAAPPTAVIELKPGRNEVDADVWRKWADLNVDHPMIAGGHVVEEPEKKA